jgi:hypothetical protein
LERGCVQSTSRSTLKSSTTSDLFQRADFVKLLQLIPLDGTQPRSEDSCLDAGNDFASIIYNDRGGTHDDSPFGETIMPQVNQTTEEIKTMAKKTKKSAPKRSKARSAAKKKK